MEYIIFFSVALLIFAFVLVQEFFAGKKREKYVLEKIEEDFHTKQLKSYEPQDLYIIKRYFERKKSADSIDDITASDLEIERLFSAFNKSESQMGSEYFYYMLRTMHFDEAYFKNIDGKVEALRKAPESRKKLSLTFHKIGSLRKYSLFDCLDLLSEGNSYSLLSDYICIILFVLSIASIFYFLNFGIIFLIAVFVYNIFSYYKKRGEIEPYVVSFSYIMNLISNVKAIDKIDLNAFLSEKESLRENLKKLNKLNFYSIFVNKANSSIGIGNPLSIIMDYLGMFLHLDIIAFYKMKNLVLSNRESVENLYDTLGFMESLISVAFIRENYDYAIPGKSESLKAVNIYHPLIENPVKNSINVETSVLLTGSNASGKSTFLKAVAINALFSKTIYTCFADEFSSDSYHVFSSMSLRDDLSNNDSYFMVEIKAIKRILDYIESNPDKRVICFLDEVLRGTNTVERIAASTEILNSLKEKALVFAATHDIELTRILNKDFRNYHFDEIIENDDVLFEYTLKEGPSDTRNAIKLLGILGYDKSIIDKATENALNYMNTGEWQVK